MAVSTESPDLESRPSSLSWLDLAKATAIAWIIFNHIVERLFGYPYIGNPTEHWPSLVDRIRQLTPLEGFGLWNVPVNLARYLGWLGDQGVTLFLIASGFGLTWGLLERRETAHLSAGAFFMRRAGRIYPPWWSVHLIFIASALVIGWGLSLTDIRTILSFAGIRIIPGLFYYFSPAWWYVGLIIQLYLVFPLLWKGLHRVGPARLLVLATLLCFISRALGFVFFESYLDAWQRGGVFITRLAEFAFGMSFAWWLNRDQGGLRKRLRSWSFVAPAIFIYILGLALSLSLAGMVLAPFLLGSTAFIFAYLILSGKWAALLQRSVVLAWAGRHSYSLYLFHHPFVLLLVPASLSRSAPRIALGIVAAVFLTVCFAFFLDVSLPPLQRLISRFLRRYGTLRLSLFLGTLALLVLGALVSSELIVRRAAPQEILGWGERPSLEPDSRFGWKLKPSRETRLRWESYDYVVVSNSLGFPGPEYPEQKTGEAYRILVTGDAFTSAEGVDTDMAWPRLLEKGLQQTQPEKIEVLNFAVTGYGPNQYTRVIQEFAPIYHPDLVLIGFFVNEYQDVLTADEQFVRSIGFGFPPQDRWFDIFKLLHLKRYLSLHLREPLLELMTGKPRPHGYFLGNFFSLEKGREDFQTVGREKVAVRLREIKSAAGKVGARVIIAMIPAPVQVCEPKDRAYFPRHVNLEDSTRYDLNLPQTMTAEICRELGIACYDIREAFPGRHEPCPY
ncbi:MAG: acyltransferase family protein, partial [Candidatus Aminicenantales bacterium]